MASYPHAVSSVPLPGPLASARDRPWPLVGREAELDTIAAAWARITGGGRETLLIAGEPGAGKSRLAAESGHAIHRAGGLVLYGSGEETNGTPYAPFASALAHLDQHVDRARLEGLRASPLGKLIPGAGDGEQRGDWNLGGDGSRLFAAAVKHLEALADYQPLLLVVDDLHDCGLSTLRLVEHLARASARLRLLLLTTYRPTDLEPDDERAALIAGLRSAPGAQHLHLGGLDAPKLRDLAAALGVAEDPDALEDTATIIERETGGNPLFACELLRSLRDAGDTSPDQIAAATPRSLRMVIATRARRLGADAYDHVSAAAVSGRRFSVRTLGAALDAEPDAVAESIAQAEHVGLISIDPTDGVCTFSHAITARCLYEEVEPARRGRLHRRLAEALEHQSGAITPQRAGEIARHWCLADPPDEGRASACCAIAGELALHRYDHEVAAGWFEEALKRSPGGSGNDVEWCDLLIGLGTALRFADQERSRTVLLEAARLADRLDDADRLVKAALANHRGFVSVVGGFDRERAAMLKRATERLTEGAPLALLLAQLALELTFSPQVERRRRLAERALGAARASGDRRVLAQVLTRYLIAYWGPENPRARVAAAAESISISSGLDEPLDLFHGLYWQAAAQVELGQTQSAARTLREQTRIAARIGDATATWLCECAASVHIALRGELEEAESRVQHAVELAQRSGQPDALAFYISQIASIRWQQGRLPELVPILDQALGQYPGLPAFRSLVCLAHALNGGEARAREVLTIDTVSGFADLPRDPVWIAGSATYAHAIAELGDREAAASVHAILEPYRDQLATTSISVWGLVGHALGRLECVLGDVERGRESLLRAIDGYARMSAPLWRAQAERDLANLQGEGGVHGSELDDRIARLGLTRRQAEVLRLVARGRSNKEIATELHVTPSTVKRHLENAYGRTGAHSRGALTALLLGADEDIAPSP